MAGVVRVVISLALEPTITGTSFCLPWANVFRISSGNTQPSTFGWVLNFLPSVSLLKTSTILSDGTARNVAIESAPAALANATPTLSADWSPFRSCFRYIPGWNEAPLSPIAPWNSPFARGVATSVLTLHDPADSPQ